MENAEDIIIVEKGDIFEGTRDQFRDCFFDNANDAEIKDWCASYVSHYVKITVPKSPIF